MRRGFSFENQISKLLKWVNSHGGHAHKNHPARTQGGVFTEGECFDYEVFYRDKKLCFDAKESQSDRWSLSNAKLMQVKHLLNCKQCGMDAFFLVYFYTNGQMIKFDVEFVRSAIGGGIKSLSATEGEVFDVKKELGI